MRVSRFSVEVCASEYQNEGLCQDGSMLTIAGFRQLLIYKINISGCINAVSKQFEIF